MIPRSFASFVVLLSTLCVAPGLADDRSAPNHMLSFLKPKMRVGMRFIDGSTDTILTVYTDDEFSLAREVAKLGRRALDAAAFADKRPDVQSKLDEYLEQLAIDSPGSDAPQVEHVYIMPRFRTSFGTIAAVGNDYVLIELEGDSKRRRILPKTSIGRIELDGEGVHFAYPTGR